MIEMPQTETICLRHTYLLDKPELISADYALFPCVFKYSANVSNISRFVE